MSAQGNLPAAGRSRRAGIAIAAAIVAFVVAIVGFAAGWLLGGRHVTQAVPSPSGDLVAYILEARCALGRCQSLKIGTAVNARVVETLNGESEEASEIAWTPDGGRVAFLVNGYQLRVFDAHTGANLGAVSLIEPDKSPSSRIARGVTFSSNGASVTFDDCPRNHSGCQPGILAIRPK
jgi:WD40 repeat protein